MQEIYTTHSISGGDKILGKIRIFGRHPVLDTGSRIINYDCGLSPRPRVKHGVTLTGRSGFTIIELAVVLVIVFIITGGVLVGHDLIKAANIRAQVSQIEDYRAATMAFEDKYGYLPGDIPAADAAQFGFTTRSGAASQGDGDGFISASLLYWNLYGGETALFWRDLSDAKLIDQVFTTATEAYADNGAAIASNDLYKFVPRAKLTGNYIGVLHYLGKNYFTLFGASGVQANGDYDAMWIAALTPHELYSVDVKIDDGVARTGKMTLLIPTPATVNPIIGAVIPSYANCVAADGINYNLTTYANKRVCSASWIDINK